MKKTKFVFILSIALAMGFGQLGAQDKLYPGTFFLGDVKLLDGPFKHACEVNTGVLLRYDTDRLLAPFLKEAGLNTKGEMFPNWEGLDGHVGGHYLSALAMHYAVTGNEECRERMEYMISELKRCQDAIGTGYIGGIPDGAVKIWDKVEAGNPRAVASGWVPWYNVHKTYAGLRDAWLYTGDETARDMFLKLCDWGITIISPLDAAQMERMLDIEFGGMNEVYADAYQMTGEEKYLDAAKRFSHRVIFDNMAKGVDNLDNKHANTQVPKAVGYQRVAELTGEEDYTAAATFFWETVVHNRSLSIGGNSRREHFPTAADCVSYVEEREGPETCNTNNMMKLTEGLFRMDPDPRYADFYERAMFNHILSSQHPAHGGYVYFTPARPQHYRVYSDVNQAMWCCVGTGMENHGKYGEFIYSHAGDSLYVNLFVASELDWKEKGVKIIQNTAFPYEEGTTLKIETKKASKFKLMVRHPWWVPAGELRININGRDFPVVSEPSSYVAIDRKWKDGDVVSVSTPMRITVEQMPNVPEYISVLYGPMVMGVRTGTEDLKGLVAGDDRWGHIANGKLIPVTEAPLIVGERDEIEARLNGMRRLGDNSLTFATDGLFESPEHRYLTFEPFYNIHDIRYSIYFLAMTRGDYDKVRAERERRERERVALDNRTVDEVKPGEQQPEADHLMKHENSRTGHFNNEAWRDARSGGFFSYNILTGGRQDLTLMVRYWGDERGARSFDILLDGEKLVTENISGKWRKGDFENVEYSIPPAMLKGKESVTVRFQPSGDNIAGGIYRVRLLKPEE